MIWKSSEPESSPRDLSWKVTGCYFEWVFILHQIGTMYAREWGEGEGEGRMMYGGGERRD